MPVASARRSQPWRVLTQAMSANHAALGPPASNLRLTRSAADSRLEARFSPEGLLAHARGAAPASLPHDAGHALARGAPPPERPQPHERLGRAVNIPHLGSDLGYQLGELFVAHGVRAGRPRLPRAVAPPGHLQRRAHLRHRPVHFVEEYELELRPLRGKAYSCLLAKKALAFKVSRSRA